MISRSGDGGGGSIAFEGHSTTAKYWFEVDDK